MSELKLTPDEAQYLNSSAAPMFNKPYIDYLSNYRFKPKEQIDLKLANVDDNGFGDLEIEIKGLWVETILYEVPLMSIISESYFANIDKDWTYEGQEELAKDKLRQMVEAGVIVSEFGSRRRRSLKGHDIVIKALKEENERLLSEEKPYSGKLAGTSNVYFAYKYGLPPIGTVAHEWTMGIAALKGYRDANFNALDLWEKTFGNSLLIALTDTFTTDAFWREFINHPQKAKKWAGIRQDSGDPAKFCKDARDVRILCLIVYILTNNILLGLH